ncbi:DUF2590 family protein [Lentisphaerota bacterium WC36G]|nr:DUF2590 family protein [Lentisphaerae bacterium WC36]
MKKYVDLKITEDTLAVDGDGQALFVSDLDCIVQDIKHMIRESGYLVEIIGERSQEQRQLYIQRIIRLVEDDERIIPGTVQITASSDNFINNSGVWSLTAFTYEYGFANLNLEVNNGQR